jgi:hypothetical protein
MDGLLGAFIRKQQESSMKPEAPNKVKEKKGTPVPKFEEKNSLAHIIEEKPSSKKVLEYIKERINEIVTED